MYILTQSSNVVVRDDGISVDILRDSDDRQAYFDWLAQGNRSNQSTPPNQDSYDAETKRSAELVLITNSKADTIYQALMTATPSQINTYVNNNFGSLNATQRSILKFMLQVCAQLLRRGIL